MKRYLVSIMILWASGIMAATHEMPYIEAGGLILVEATFANQSGYFIFDSGSNSVIVHSKESPTKADATFYTLAGPLNATLLPSRDIQLGQYQRSVQEAYGADLSYLNELISSEVEIVGILGGHIFTPHAITIDKRKRTIKVITTPIPPQTASSSLPIDFGADFPMTSFKIGDKTYNFVIDSGAKSHHISPEILLENSTLYRLTDNQVNIFTAGGEHITSNAAIIKNVVLADDQHTTLRAIITDFSETSAALGIQIDGILSLHALESDQITIDLDLGRLYF